MVKVGSRETLRWYRWVIVAGSTFFTEILVFWICSTILNIWISNFAALLVANSYNFYMHKKWTFRDSEKNQSRVFRYLFAITVSYLFGSAGVLFFSPLLNSKIFAKVLVQVLLIPANYLFLRNFVFGLNQFKIE
jgi:H+/Cl- antiporter ClcA